MNWIKKHNSQQTYFESRIGMDRLWVYEEKGKYKGLFLKDGCLYLLHTRKNQLLLSDSIEKAMLLVHCCYAMGISELEEDI